MTKKDELQPKSDALEAWENLPSTTPSKQALPPATGGLTLGYKVLGAFFLIMVFITFWYIAFS